jgi:hypothetical protein
VGAAARDLTADQKTLAGLLFEMAANEAREDQAQAAAAQALAESLKARATGATDLAGRFGDLMQAAIVGTRSKDDMLSFLRAVAALVPTQPSREALRELVAAQIPSADQPQILAVLDLMSEADVAAFYADVSGQARASFSDMVGAIDLFVVACQESIPFNSREGFQAYSATLKFQFLNLDTGAQAQMYDICDLFTPAPREGHHDPVTSDIPALVLYGLNDTQTSSADAKDTAREPRQRPRPRLPRGGPRRADLLAMRPRHRARLRRTPRGGACDRLHRGAEAAMGPAAGLRPGQARRRASVSLGRSPKARA